MAEIVKEEPQDYDENAGPVLPEYYYPPDNSTEQDYKCDINLRDNSSTVVADDKVDIKHDSPYYQQFLNKEPWDAGEGTSKQAERNVEPQGIVETIKAEFDSDNNELERDDNKSMFEEQLHDIGGSTMNVASGENGQRSPSSSTDDESDNDCIQSQECCDYFAKCDEHNYATCKHRKLETKYRCKLCDYSHDKLSQLQRHIDKMHENINELECEKCGFRTFSMLDMESHVTDKHHEKRHKCKVCDFASNSTYNLQRHVKFAHSHVIRKKSDTRHTCDICGYSTCRKADMQKHIDRIHVGVKRFKCDYCDYAAFCNADLRNHHVRKHATPFTCELCDVTTYSRQSLQSHKATGQHQVMLKMTKENEMADAHPNGAYKCIYCRYVTKEATDFGRHVACHYRDGKIRCRICDFRAESSFALDEHIKRRHSLAVNNVVYSKVVKK